MADSINCMTCSPYLHQLSSFDSIWSNTIDDFRKVNSPSKTELGVKSHNMNKIIISAQWVHLKSKQRLRWSKEKPVLTGLEGRAKGNWTTIFAIRDVNFTVKYSSAFPRSALERGYWLVLVLLQEEGQFNSDWSVLVCFDPPIVGQIKSLRLRSVRRFYIVNNSFVRCKKLLTYVEWCLF